MSDVKTPTPCHLTQFGFRFGAAEVTRCCELPGGRVVVKVQPDRGEPLEIYISATGKSVRIFRAGREWKERDGGDARGDDHAVGA